MGRWSAGRIVGLLAGPLLLVVVLGASPPSATSGRLTSHQSGISNSDAAPGTKHDSSTAGAGASIAGPTTTVPPMKCPVTEAPVATCGACLPGVQQTASCKLCPKVYTQGPLLVGCPRPVPLPPNRQQPPTHPAIYFCASPILQPNQPGLVSGPGTVCGTGFHASEGLTLTAGRFSWLSHADGAGRFRALLPPALCRAAPVSLVVTGVSGDRSNTLTITRNSCLSLP